jgi:hypothetical protein
VGSTTVVGGGAAGDIAARAVLITADCRNFFHSPGFIVRFTAVQR